MQQSYVESTSKSRMLMNAFGGLNQTAACQPNEFRDLMNLSSDAYPYLTQRVERRTTKNGLADGRMLKSSIIYDGKLAAVFGDDLWYDEELVLEGLGTKDTTCTLLANGAELYVFPKGISYNVVTKESRNLSAMTTIDYLVNHMDHIVYKSCDSNGEEMSGGGYFKIMFATTSSYAEEIENELKEKFSNFKVGDGVKFIGYVLKEAFPENTYSTIVNVGFDKDKEFTLIDEPDSTIKLSGLYWVFQGDIEGEGVWPLEWAPKYDVDGNFCTPGANTANIFIKKDIPVLDFYTVCQNRVWGCVYKDGLNEIRCSALGDPSNWNTFAGVSTDSYAVSIGEEGAFTGAFTYNDEPYFFKENTVFKVYGGYPATYQVYPFSCSGVEAGSERSIITSEGYMFYKTPNDFCVFNGSQPQSVSHNLGFEKYHNVVAGAIGGKIYWSCLSDAGESVLLVYDRNTGLWYKEKDARYLDFCQDNAGHLIGITEDHIVTFKDVNAKDGENTEWYAETGLIGMDILDQKTVSKYTLRADMEVGATLSVLASYDDGDFEPLYSCVGEGKISSHTFSVKPVRCDHLRLRLEGVGRCTIYSIAYTIEQRSEYP